MPDSGTVLDIGDHTVEVLASPAETGDRYLLRIVAEPGGPGIKGDFPHIHPVLVETFQCVSGEMVARVGRDIVEVSPGEKIEVAAGQVHGFLNTGTSNLVADSEVIFLQGYRIEDDLMRFAAIYDQLRRQGPVKPKTGEPPLLQMAVLTRTYRRVLRQPSIAGLLIPPLALVGRLRGYRARFHEIED
jgi:mannose-6-phosphate isomerase-like protein (cupin superfamily)